MDCLKIRQKRLQRQKCLTEQYCDNTLKGLLLEVSIDMTGNYKSLVRKICPNAEITVDRFHLVKMIYEELNQTKFDQKKTAEELNIKERAKLLGSLKGNKYTLIVKFELYYFGIFLKN